MIHIILNYDGTCNLTLFCLRLFYCLIDPFYSCNDVLAVLSDTNVFSPLTVTPSPDVMALKLQQVAEKSVPASGESKLLRKVREQRENKRKPAASESAKVSHWFVFAFKRFL